MIYFNKNKKPENIKKIRVVQRFGTPSGSHYNLFLEIIIHNYNLLQIIFVRVCFCVRITHKLQAKLNLIVAPDEVPKNKLVKRRVNLIVVIFSNC